MDLKYKLKIDDPSSHFARICIEGKRPKKTSKLVFFLPSWSPGSYLMREYGRNIRGLNVKTGQGKDLFFKQIDKSQWVVQFDDSAFKTEEELFSLSYDVYCHELTVRTSHVDESHAFLHGPSLFMGVLDQEQGQNSSGPELTLEFPSSWSKVTTGLASISKDREIFLYRAKNYDELIDSPIEIGCQETDGFQLNGKDHELGFYGPVLAHKENLKKDIKTIVEFISGVMGGMPYEKKYTFITHFLPNTFGGLEHLNSTALQFCSFAINERKSYLKWLELVAHEYFHTWNVKRIRPRELGPFNYVKEGLTRMHWLTEGLTSFMDQLFLLRSKLCTQEEYGLMIKENINRYLKTPGRKFHSLEDSSFNAWIKLYRPDENSLNSSISYYLKGGIVFFALNSMLFQAGKDINDFLKLLWERYLENPEVGMDDYEVYEIIEKLTSKKEREQFEVMIQTTEEIDLDQICKTVGLEIIYDDSVKVEFGLTPRFEGERVFISSVSLDGAACKSGLNAADEIIAISGMRLMKKNYFEVEKILIDGENYEVLVARLGVMRKINVRPCRLINLVKEVKIYDEILMKQALGG